MNYQLLINNLNKYGDLSEQEKANIKKAVIYRNVKKKDILVHKMSLCNKLFFVNKGLLRTYYIDVNGYEFTRRIAWENGFLTNMNSFRKNGIENNETIECIENAEILEISKNELDNLLASSETISKIYQIILEKYMAVNIRRYQNITTSCPKEKLINFNKNYPELKKRINDTILATFLAMSRKTLIRARRNIIKG